MQFLTVRERQNGTDKWLRQSGGRGQFFIFDYEVCHNPATEGVSVQFGHVEEWALREYGPEITTGVRAGHEEAQRRGIRLLGTNLFIPAFREMPCDTTRQLVRERLTVFVQSRIIEWAKPTSPLHKDWLTSDVVALARGIHSNAALDGLPALHDALLEAGCDDSLVMEHLQTCPDHSPSCWVAEVIVDQAASRS